MGSDPSCQREGRSLLPSGCGAHDDSAARWAHHQYRFYRGQRVHRRIERGLCRQQGAVISLTKTAAQQLGKHNINVNAICPGVTRTALSDANLAVRAQQEGLSLEAMEKRRAEVIPLQRVNDPSDIAAMAVFLASPGARNITGQAYNVDGGTNTS